MSLIDGLNSPVDLLMKLFREGRRAVANQDSQIDLLDHFYNFSVIAHSLQDWCIDYLKLDRKLQKQMWDAEKSLCVAKDIANSSKHFKITMYTPDVVSTKRDLTEFAAIVFSPFDVSDEGVVAGKYMKNSFVIHIDGAEVDLYDFMMDVLRYWLKFFDDKSIARNGDLNEALIFVNRNGWPASLLE
jgi:hypothetical protein